MSWVPLEDSSLSLSPSLLGSFGTCSSVARGSTILKTHKINPNVPVVFLLTFCSPVYLPSTFPASHCTFASTLIIDLFCIFLYLITLSRPHRSIAQHRIVSILVYYPTTTTIFLALCLPQLHVTTYIQSRTERTDHCRHGIHNAL